MKIIQTELDGVLIVEPDVFEDPRGFFMETYNENRYRDAGVPSRFVQDNFSYSVCGTLRGLHFQHPKPQAKLVQVVFGTIYDVAVDIRRGSPTFGKWLGVYLSGDTKKQLYIPEGFAHGFAVVSNTAMFAYKCSDFYSPETENGILWNDPDLGIEWPVETPLLSKKDTLFRTLRAIPDDRLPAYSGGAA